MSPYQLDPICCRKRQQRLLDEMRLQDCDSVVVTSAEHVQWLSGVRYSWTLQSALALFVDGRAVLAAPNRAPDSAAVDETVVFEAQSLATLRNDQSERCLTALNRATPINKTGTRVGVEFSRFPKWYATGAEVSWLDFEPLLYRLRRRKDEDELLLMRRAIAATERMYAHARSIILPGITELEVYNQLQAVAVEEFGEPPTATGNDYQCASPGGPPRSRTSNAGELFILDLGPAYRGYFADNCRTIAVQGATDDQLQAWETVVSVLQLVEKTVRPGTSAKSLYLQARNMLERPAIGEFFHHLGHGVGLFPHESPHLNPEWDDHFQEGDVFSAEPGLYGPNLRAGIRIEQNYRVTSEGVELLSAFPFEL